MVRKEADGFRTRKVVVKKTKRVELDTVSTSK